MSPQKIVVVGGGPVGALSALYAARRGYDVELYDLRDGELSPRYWVDVHRIIQLTYDHLPRSQLRRP
jgi:2-polyprenyl-6-methoxyphenol hydroxylase-like FAD-dependent oxidoreductase